MPKNKNKPQPMGITNILLIILIIVVVTNAGNITNTYNYEYNTQTINNMLNQPDDEEDGTGTDCRLQLSESQICKGESVTGTITDGESTTCWAFVLLSPYHANWQLAYTGVTDSNGKLTDTVVVDHIGNLKFRAVCDNNTNNIPDPGDCITNYAYLEVIDCGDDDGNDGDNGNTPPACSLLCQELWGFDTGTEAVGGACDIGIFKTDGTNGCCCWNEASDPVCESAYPTPVDPQDCWSRPGCDASNKCVFIEGGLMGVNRCECMLIDTCNEACIDNGYRNGYCSYEGGSDPCGADSDCEDGDQYCEGGDCCCSY
jgi:hypothetical protein